MPPAKKNGKAVSRPLPSNFAQGDISSTESVAKKKVKSSVMASNSSKISSDKVEKSKMPFRHRWQKKGRFPYQDDLIKSEQADALGENKAKRGVTTPKYDAADDVDGDESASGEDTLTHQHTGGKTTLPDAYDDSGNEESDVELMQEGSDDDYGATAVKQPIGPTRKPNPNGRCKGRKLVMWHRPRMVEKLLLHIQYECHRSQAMIPWDRAVERLSTGSSGASALQHLSKMRDVLITEGHMVPPLLGKKSVAQDPTIRGYIRDLESDKPTDTKVVRWGEYVEDRKENLQIEGVIRGSGNYRRATAGTYHRGTDKAIEKTQKATGKRRNRLPVELREDRAAAKGTEGTVQKHTKGKRYIKKEKNISSPSSSRSASVDPAELDSDDEYDPSASSKKGKYGGRSRVYSTRKYNLDVSEDENEDDDDYDNEPQEPLEVSTPQSKGRMGHNQGLQGLTPPASMEKIVKFQVGKDAIDRLVATGKIGKDNDKDTGMADAQSGNDMQDCLKEGLFRGAEAFGKDDTQYIEAPLHPLARDVVGTIGYQGMSIHGTKAQYDHAIRNGLNPKVNGIKYNQATASTVAENGSAYSLPAPPAYSPTGVPKSSSPLAGTSAGAFTGFGSPGSPKGATMAALNFNSFNESPLFMNGFGQGNTSLDFGVADHTMSDSAFFSNLSHFTSGSDMFSAGSNIFPANGLPAASFDDFRRHTGLEIAMDGDITFDTTNHRNADSSVGRTSSASGSQVTANNIASTTPANFDNQDDAVSLAASTPPHYLQYAQQDGGDNKVNREWYNF